MTNWTDDNINVFDLLQKKVLNKLDKNLEIAEERLKLVEELLNDEGVDKALEEYIGSEEHKRKTIKGKNDWLSERDYNLKKFEIIADYLVYPDRKEYNILSNYALRNSGVKVHIDGSKSKFKRVLPISEAQILIKDSDDDWQSGYSEYTFKDNVKLLYTNETYIERLMNNTELLDDNIYLSVDFGNIKHVKSILCMYDELKNLLICDENYESDVWRVLETIDDLIEKTEFEDDMKVIIDYIKQGLSYVNIYKKIIKTHNLSYDQVKYLVREGIPTKLVNTYNEMVKGYDYYKNKYIDEIKNRKGNNVNWFDEDRYNYNLKIKQKYQSFVNPSKITKYYLGSET